MRFLNLLGFSIGMGSGERKREFSVFFWSFFLTILAIIVFYYFAYQKAFGEELWLTLSAYSWIFNALFLFLVAMVIAKIIARFARNRFKEIEEAESLKFDKTRLSIIESLVTITIYIIALLVIINSVAELRAYGVSLLAGVGFSAIIIGFAAQETISNIIAGLLIAIYRPFRVSDRIMFKDNFGRVEDITLRHTVMKTWENKRLVIPNSLISKEMITNYTFKGEKILMHIDMNISYDADIDKARKIMIGEAKKHPDYFDPHQDSPLAKKGEPVKVRLRDFGDSSVILRLYFWSKNYPTGFKAACDLRESIKKRFDKEGVEIPFPYRTLVYKKDLKKKRG